MHANDRVFTHATTHKIAVSLAELCAVSLMSTYDDAQFHLECLRG